MRVKVQGSVGGNGRARYGAVVVLNFYGEVRVSEEAAIVISDKGATWSSPAVNAGQKKDSQEVGDVQNIVICNIASVHLYAHGASAQDGDGLVFISKTDHETLRGEVNVVGHHVSKGAHDAGGSGVGA
jgi:hypothetical protein